MKFLCVQCDEPMKLIETEGPEEGSLTLVFGCPRCPNRVAMLTNPWETQLVRALDVKVGSPRTTTAPLDFVRSSLARKREGLELGGSMAGAEGAAVADLPWSREAAQRLGRVPSFVRAMVREGIERFAREQGYQRITEQVMDEARRAIGM